MFRWLWLLLALVVSTAGAGRLTAFEWDWMPDWPPGTTVELCGNGNVCLSGITGTQATLDLPVNPGDVILGRARAVAPAGYQCGDPPAPCPYSEWATVAQTWPALPVGVWARYELEEYQSVGFDYVSSSFSTNEDTNGGWTIAINTIVAAQADDIILAVVSYDSRYNVSSISSSNTTWSQITTFDHTANVQAFELWGGIVTGNLNSGSTITVNFSGDTPYRAIQIAHFRSDNGIDVTPYNTYNSVTYNGAVNPTTTDGYSVSVTPTGTNALTAVAILEIEDDPGSTSNSSPQSGFTQISEGFIFPGINVGPYLWAYKTGISAGTQNVTATYSQTSSYGSSFAVVILEGGAAAGGSLPFLPNYYNRFSPILVR